MVLVLVCTNINISIITKLYMYSVVQSIVSIVLGGSR